ncbi:hypothetical protein CHS0354_035414 [Potamilus streckersoni]|uniref:Kelch repeat-containing protein n=1 Tax=Potamilus streckersoni TaxID=2493646 RepID=A0AAE0TDJ9_9BIVA|nr:hypothetical protein CHS0354_035414 [Potamilus streckersoni]
MLREKETHNYQQDMRFQNTDDPIVKERLYVQNLPDEERKKLAKFLSDGYPACLQLNELNFHSFLHLCSLRTFSGDDKLFRHCISFYNDVKSENKLDSLQCCADCKRSLDDYEAKMTFTCGNICKTGENVRYTVLFLNEYVNEKQTVKVVELASTIIVHKQSVQKISRFGHGFSVCSQIRNDCPYIFISGGKGPSGREMMEYDVIENKWKKCPPLPRARINQSMISVEENIYLIGGGISSIVKYNTRTKIYSTIGYFEKNISNPLVIQYHKCLYIFGGRTSNEYDDDCDVPSVRKLDMTTNVLDGSQDLPVAFSGGQAVLLNDKVYIATPGGSLICFDPKTGRSRLCSSQNFNRDLFFMFVSDNRLCVLGGIEKSKKTFCRTLDRYCPEQDCWRRASEVKTDFPIIASCILQYPHKCPVLPFQ